MCQKKSRCHGDCCRRFTLPMPPDVLEQDYQKFLDNWEDPTKPLPIYGEIWQIGSMVKYLGLSDIRADGTKQDPPIHWYTCRYLSENGDCSIYPRRPRMCSEYPYGGRCEYPGCQSEEARTGKLLPPEQGGVVAKHLDVVYDKASIEELTEERGT